MKTTLRFRGLNAHPSWQTIVQDELQRIEGLAAIASAQVTLERQREVKPAFRVQAQLEVPGPDFHAEAADHTLPAALRKVVNDLEHQIRSRLARRVERRRSNLQLGISPNRPALAAAGHRS